LFLLYIDDNIDDNTGYFCFCYTSMITSMYNNLFGICISHYYIVTVSHCCSFNCSFVPVDCCFIIMIHCCLDATNHTVRFFNKYYFLIFSTCTVTNYYHHMHHNYYDGFTLGNIYQYAQLVHSISTTCFRSKNVVQTFLFLIDIVLDL
jgi:hypothetical protein